MSDNYKLSCAATRVLLNIAEGKRPEDGLNGRSAHGGHQRVMWSLHKHGYLEAGALTQKAREELNLVIEEVT